MSTFFVSSTKRTCQRSARAVVLLEVPVSEEEGQLERVCEADEPELCGGRQRLGDVRAVECSAEAHVSRALNSHEHMFALKSRGQ